MRRRLLEDAGRARCDIDHKPGSGPCPVYGLNKHDEFEALETTGGTTRCADAPANALHWKRRLGGDAGAGEQPALVPIYRVFSELPKLNVSPVAREVPQPRSG